MSHICIPHTAVHKVFIYFHSLARPRQHFALYLSRAPGKNISFDKTTLLKCFENQACKVILFQYRFSQQSMHLAFLFNIFLSVHVIKSLYF